MLIGLVRESVKQCFCHTCTAPLPLSAARRHVGAIAKVKTKPRTLQPSSKKVQFVTTEVRCQEKTKGGLCYEVILSEPETKTPPRRISGTPNKIMSKEEVEEKLKAAEERRNQLQCSKIAVLNAQLMKIEEASRKREENTTSFISTTQKALEQKMDAHHDNREAHLTELKSKMKEHLENVEKTRLSFEQQCDAVRASLQKKLKTASVNREENIKKMIEQLNKHEEQVQRVRKVNAEKYQKLETAVQKKLGQAQQRRSQLEQEQIEKLRNHNSRLTKIRTESESELEVRKSACVAQIETKLTVAELNREQEILKKLEAAKKYNELNDTVLERKSAVDEIRKSEQSKLIENKLSTAEQNRVKEIQRKLENIKKNERRAETVRQNKANLLTNGDQVTASSG